ncbi:MAG: HipA domain-containing protein [Paludibacteraceae bacterium]|nr:HipA domain-containing protein [Paludibacteraceae bacterium]
MTTTRSIYVYFDDAYTATPQLIGVLTAQLLRGKEVFSFEFADEWLHDSRCKQLDPDLQLFTGRQYLPDNKSNFGLFLDSSPDRWGRVLLDRRESLRAKEEQRAPEHLHESDYLLGVFDESRMGAIRVKLDPDGAFLDNDPDYSTPPLTMLRDLEHASWEYEADQANSRWLQMLLAPGSSLGGARPKANVRMPDGSLWIAKFPSRHDDTNIGAWEAIAMTMAKQCGIDVAPFQTVELGNQYATFLTRRFDRTDDHRRIHFTSAMTMLGYTDGETAGVSYLELADWITRYCCRVEENLLQLWRRMVFNIAIHNCDDHLRNHGFLLTPQGWTLSPAYDLNPQPFGVGLSLNINERDNALDFALAMEVAPYFGLTTMQAEQIIATAFQVVSHWRSLATKAHISRDEQERMMPAFFYSA